MLQLGLGGPQGLAETAERLLESSLSTRGELWSCKSQRPRAGTEGLLSTFIKAAALSQASGCFCRLQSIPLPGLFKGLWSSKLPAPCAKQNISPCPLGHALLLLPWGWRVWLEGALPLGCCHPCSSPVPLGVGSPAFLGGGVGPRLPRSSPAHSGRCAEPLPSSVCGSKWELRFQTKSSDSRWLQRGQEPAGRAWQCWLPDFQVKGNK